MSGKRKRLVAVHSTAGRLLGHIRATGHRVAWPVLCADGFGQITADVDERDRIVLEPEFEGTLRYIEDAELFELMLQSGMYPPA